MTASSGIWLAPAAPPTAHLTGLAVGQHLDGCGRQLCWCETEEMVSSSSLLPSARLRARLGAVVIDGLPHG